MADVTDKLIGDGPGKKWLARKKFWTVNLRFSKEQYHSLLRGPVASVLLFHAISAFFFCSLMIT